MVSIRVFAVFLFTQVVQGLLIDTRMVPDKRDGFGFKKQLFTSVIHQPRMISRPQTHVILVPQVRQMPVQENPIKSVIKAGIARAIGNALGVHGGGKFGGKLGGGKFAGLGSGKFAGLIQPQPVVESGIYVRQRPAHLVSQVVVRDHSRAMEHQKPFFHKPQTIVIKT